MKIRVFEAFAGIGTQRMALDRLGIEHDVVAIAEIDKFAIKSYEAIHGKTNNLGDISKIQSENIPEHDLFTYSFPCQDISIAGKQGGLDEGSGTRSSLLWECNRVIETAKPKYLLMENVKNLVGKRHKSNFDKWLEHLEGLGYTNYWDVLNAKDYGVPQNRERVFVVSILGEHEPYKFPEKQELNLRLKDVLEGAVDEKFYLDKEKVDKLIINSDKLSLGYMPERNGAQHQSNTISREISSENPSDRTAGSQTGQRLDVNKHGTSNTIATVQKDNCVVDFREEPICFYAKDNVLIDSITLKNHFNNTLPFEFDYVYVEPYIYKDGDTFIIINECVEQGERIRWKETIWISEEVIHDNDYLDKLINETEPKKEFGRMGKQAVEALNENAVKYGDTINPFNKHVSSRNGISPTLTTRPEGFKTAVLPISEDLRIRKLTPKECWRLMGIDDESFYKAQTINSNAQLYKQAGNAIVVDVLVAIFKQIKELNK